MKTTGLKRVRTDKFYTKNPVADKCIEAVKKHLPSENIFIIEPSAGNGAFVQQIKTLTNSFAFYDIEPDHEESFGAYPPLGLAYMAAMLEKKGYEV